MLSACRMFSTLCLDRNRRLKIHHLRSPTIPSRLVATAIPNPIDKPVVAPLKTFIRVRINLNLLRLHYDELTLF